MLAYNYPPCIGGAEKLISELCGALANDGVYVVAGSNDPAAEKEYDPKLPYPVKRIRLAPTSFSDRLNIKINSFITDGKIAFYEHCATRSYKYARKIADEFKPDVVISGWGFMLGGAIMLKAPNRKIAAIAYGDDCIEAKGSPRLISWWKNLDILIAISNFTRNLLIELGVQPDRVIFIPPGIDPSISALPRRMPDLQSMGIEGRNIILTVCRLVPHKGTDVLIDAMNLVRKQTPEAVLVIAGDGPYRSELDRRARNSDQRDHIFFTGKIDEEEKRGWYQACRVFAMPSRQDAKAGGLEGYGYTFLEANAFGKPVVGGKPGGIPDAVNEGVTGLLVNPTDIEDTANALISLVGDNDLASRLGENGRKWVERDRNKETFLRNAVSVLKMKI